MKDTLVENLLIPGKIEETEIFGVTNDPWGFHVKINNMNTQSKYSLKSAVVEYYQYAYSESTYLKRWRSINIAPNPDFCFYQVMDSSLLLWLYHQSTELMSPYIGEDENTTRKDLTHFLIITGSECLDMVMYGVPIVEAIE